MTAAPPKRAATPTAPVFMGIAMPLVLELDAAPEAPPTAPEAAALGAVIATVGPGMLLVKGTTDALLAPE